MSTSGNDSGNKLALRASLKKEDESLGERLAATDVPLLVPPVDDLAAAAAPATQAPLTPLGQTVSRKPAGKRLPAAGKGVGRTEATTTVAGKAARKAGDKTAADNAPPGKAKKAAPVKTAKGSAGAVPPGGQAGGQSGAPKATGSKPAAEAAVGTKAGKPEKAGEKVGKAAKEKRDKRVRLSFDLLKSEEAAIEAVRAELAKVAGWAASQSDILRAGVRLFAEQKLEQMKEMLDGLSTLAGRKGKKRG